MTPNEREQEDKIDRAHTVKESAKKEAKAKLNNGQINTNGFAVNLQGA